MSLRRKVRRSFGVLLAHIDCVLFGEEHELQVHRAVYGSCFGIGLAYVFWWYVLCELGLPAAVIYFLYFGLLLFMGIGYPFARRIRCISLLICVGFFGRAGRSYMKAVLLAIIIAGPIFNIILNCKEVVRVFECSSRLSYNLTKNRFDLLTAPFHRSLYNLPKNVTQINDAFERISNVLQPIHQEITRPDEPSNNATKTTRRRTAAAMPEDSSKYMMTDADESKAVRVRQEYVEKIRGRCQGQMDRGLERCRKAFRDAHARCWEKLPAVVNALLCWPMKVTVVCRAVMPSGADICNPSDSVDASMGHDYVELNGTAAMMSAVRVEVTTEEAKETMGKLNKKAKSVGKNIMQDFDRKWSAFNAYMYFVRKMLAWMFLKVVKNAITYHRKYLVDIGYDNAYISNYFQRLDENRRLREHRTLLPFKKIERSPLMRVTSLHRTSKEFWAMIAQLCKATLEMVAAICFLLLDHLLAVGLEIVAKHARIEFTQEGEHILNIQVNGTGVIAQLVRNTVADVNLAVEVNMISNNIECLPKPHHLVVHQYAGIIAMCLTIFFLIYIETYLQRLRHCICAYFYFRREKQRILYLYNECLKRRRGRMREIERTLEKQWRRGESNTQARRGVCFSRHLPWWMRWFAVCRRQCIICRDPEPYRRRKSAETMIKCALCQTVMCLICWGELGSVCLVCRYRAGLRAGAGGLYPDDSSSGSDLSNSDSE